MDSGFIIGTWILAILATLIRKYTSSDFDHGIIAITIVGFVFALFAWTAKDAAVLVTPLYRKVGLKQLLWLARKRKLYGEFKFGLASAMIYMALFILLFSTLHFWESLDWNSTLFYGQFFGIFTLPGIAVAYFLYISAKVS